MSRPFLITGVARQRSGEYDGIQERGAKRCAGLQRRFCLARYSGPVCRLCRREGMKLFLKGERCHTEKCAIEKRNFAPGQHGKDKKPKLVGYGLQLREKQKARRYYRVLEGQFRNLYEKAVNQKGTSRVSSCLRCWSGLDNILYRMGLATSRAQGRQLVRHGHVNVNGRKVDIPSYTVKPGDVVEIREERPAKRNIWSGAMADAVLIRKAAGIDFLGGIRRPAI